MDEYISREAVFQVVHGIARGIATKDTEALKAKDMKTLYKIKGAKEILDSVDTNLCYIPSADVQPVNRWISVEDRLPDEGASVLICTNGGIRSVSARYGNRFFITIVEAFTEDTVTHWMPLPELPKDGDK